MRELTVGTFGDDRHAGRVGRLRSADVVGAFRTGIFLDVIIGPGPFNLDAEHTATMAAGLGECGLRKKGGFMRIHNGSPPLGEFEAGSVGFAALLIIANTPGTSIACPSSGSFTVRPFQAAKGPWQVSQCECGVSWNIHDESVKGKHAGSWIEAACRSEERERSFHGNTV